MTSHLPRASMTAAVLTVVLAATVVAAVPEGSPLAGRAWAAAIQLPDVPPPPPRALQPTPPVPRTDLVRVLSETAMPCGQRVTPRLSKADRTVAGAAGAAHHSSASAVSGGINTAS